MSVIAHPNPVLRWVRKGTAGEKPSNSLDWSGLLCLPFPDNPHLGAAAGSSPSHPRLFLLQPAFRLSGCSLAARVLPRRQRKASLMVLVRPPLFFHLYPRSLKSPIAWVIGRGRPATETQPSCHHTEKTLVWASASYPNTTYSFVPTSLLVLQKESVKKIYTLGDQNSELFEQW